MWSFCPGSGFRVTEPGSAGTLCWTEWNFGQIPSTTISLLWCLKSTFTFDQYMLLLRGVKDFLPVWDWSLCWFVQISVRLKTDLGPFLIGGFVVDPQTHQSEKDMKWAEDSERQEALRRRRRQPVSCDAAFLTKSRRFDSSTFISLCTMSEYFFHHFDYWSYFRECAPMWSCLVERPRVF